METQGKNEGILLFEAQKKTFEFRSRYKIKIQDDTYKTRQIYVFNKCKDKIVLTKTNNLPLSTF
jgi:hypothetical protein